MSKRISFKELIAFEKKYNLWKYKLFDYPLWIHCREPLVNSTMKIDRRIKTPTIIGIFKSFFQTMKFLLLQYKYEKVFFLMERAELLEIYKKDDSKKLLFLNPEQEKVYEGDDYISSDFFSLLRFLSRKIAYIIFRKKYQSVINDLEKISCEPKLNEYIKVAMGDALFLKFLSLVLLKKYKKYYSGAVIPMGEKFVNKLNSYEVQHGVIHPVHVGYMNIPEVKNTLILYSKNYEKIMRLNHYAGKIIIDNYKKTFFEKTTNRYFNIVIYTQPALEMQEGIKSFISTYKPDNFFIQKHPKDYFNYNIDSTYFVTETIPNEVGYPIMYTSSIIENFILYDKKCYIYNLKNVDLDLNSFLSIYTMEINSKMIIMDSLNEIYEHIKGDSQC